jgi:hypothetical protein
MRALITACTERIFSKELVPLAHLTFGEVCAVNDNELRFAVRPAICPQHQLGRKADEARRPRRLDASSIAQRLPPPLPPLAPMTVGFWVTDHMTGVVIGASSEARTAGDPPLTTAFAVGRHFFGIVMPDERSGA